MQYISYLDNDILIVYDCLEAKIAWLICSKAA
jgi:hypothetical protein